MRTPSAGTRAVSLQSTGPLRGEVDAPPDKSISHRALIFASIASGRSIVRNILRADDPMRTLGALRSLGIDITDDGKAIEIHGEGLHSLRSPGQTLDCGNSGTTMRLLAGLLAGQPFTTILTGDSSLCKRPMRRIITPLRLMGASLTATSPDMLPPLTITGGQLHSISYDNPVASAQVKSAILLAGLYTHGKTTVTEPQQSRDHTERMLAAMGADLTVAELSASIRGGRRLSPFDMTVPGDFSSAAFLLAAATIIPGSEVIIRNVGINPTRTGFLDALNRMGASIRMARLHEVSGEPVVDFLCRPAQRLTATDISPEEVPAIIDELPIFSVVATQAEGTTTIRGAGELRVKESDRIAAMATALRAMWADVEELPEGMQIRGPTKLRGAALDCRQDHRVAMALSVAALAATGQTTITGVETVDTSYPGFYYHLKVLSASHPYPTFTSGL